MMTAVDTPDLTPLESAAALTHEMYLTLQRAGFSPEHALEIVLRLISAHQQEA